DLHAERTAERLPSVQGGLRAGFDGAGRDGDFGAVEKGLRPRAATSAYRTAIEQGVSARVQRGQACPHRDEHSARKYFGGFGGGGAGREDFFVAGKSARDGDRGR